VIQPMRKYKVELAWSATDTIEKWDIIMKWCVEHFGLPGGRWISTSSIHQTVFRFKNLRDASLFSLKWS